MLNALLALALAVTFVVTPPSALASAQLDAAAAVEIVEDLDPEPDALVVAETVVSAAQPCPCENVNAADPPAAGAVPPPVPPPERAR